MKITSPVFSEGGKIPLKFSCQGENINPPLEFSDIPKNSVSLVLIMDDPDAPIGLWVHWIVFNILPSTKSILENSFPKEAVAGKNTHGSNSYGGPCPPDRTHRYFFKLYALDTMLNLGKETDKDVLEAAMKDHVIDKAELIGLYDKVTKP